MILETIFKFLLYGKLMMMLILLPMIIERKIIFSIINFKVYSIIKIQLMILSF